MAPHPARTFHGRRDFVEREPQLLEGGKNGRPSAPVPPTSSVAQGWSWYPIVQHAVLFPRFCTLESSDACQRPVSRGENRVKVVEVRGSLSPAVTRAAAILDLLGADGAGAIRLSELARQLRLPKSSVANICAALAEAKMIRQTPEGFALGQRLAELGGAYLRTVGHVEHFHRAANALLSASEETLQLGVLDGLDVTYMARHVGHRPVQVTSTLGRRYPASCTAIGKACLSALDHIELERRLAGVNELPTLTARSLRTVPQLMADLRAVRDRGYAVDDGETSEGIVCYAVAIKSPNGREGPYAVSATLLRERASDEHIAAVLKDLRTLAHSVSSHGALGV